MRGRYAMNYGNQQKWIEWYEKKTGDKFIVPDGYVINHHERRGIMTLKSENDMLVVGYVVGDGRFWHDAAEVIAKTNKYRCIATICTRNVEAYIRFWRYKIVKEWNKNGEKRFLCKNRGGCYATLTYRGKDSNTGVDTYYVVQYMAPGDKPKLEE